MSEQQENKTLNLYPLDYPFETLVNRINAEPAKLILDPDFQRKYKWDKDGWGRASKFIESCLMRIPLPSCYFAEDEEGNHMVIDGVQRLTTINLFFHDDFKLEGMTSFKELEGKKFSELGSLKSELESTTIRCIVLRKENPKKLVREIFSRLNQGAVALSDQEIRHAIYPGSLNDLLIELGEHAQIKRFGLSETSDSQRDSREPEEQILRFFAFAEDTDLETYTATLSEFLDKYMEKNSNIIIDEIDKFRQLFNKAISNCVHVFEEDVFVNLAAERKRKGLVHYDLLMPTVGLLCTETVNQHSQAIKDAYEELCKSSDFQKTLSGGLQNRSSIIKRRVTWNPLLKAAVE